MRTTLRDALIKASEGSPSSAEYTPRHSRDIIRLKCLC
jgi:hypothetical protein